MWIMDSRPDELDDFKTAINLTELMASFGYGIDRKASSRNSAVMAHPDGDKLVVARGRDGHWVYFSVRDDRDHGSVIDFVQRRTGENLGHTRKRLRQWHTSPTSPTAHAGPRPDPLTYAPALEPIARDLAQVRARVAGMDPIQPDHPYLVQVRRIPPALLAQERFAGCLLIDQRGNVVFPHEDGDGVCGYELKNNRFTGFAPGGVKGLWGSRIRENDRAIVIAESGVDALSYAALHGSEGMRYLSTAGRLNDTQPGLIRAAIEELGQGRVIAAVDHDAGGDELAQVLETLCLEHRSPQIAFERHSPPNTGEDWNDALRASVGDSGQNQSPQPNSG